MGYFVLTCLAIVAGCIFFWLIIYPALLLAGILAAVLYGFRRGLKGH